MKLARQRKLFGSSRTPLSPRPRASRRLPDIIFMARLSRRHQLDVLRRRHGHLEPGAGDILDEGMCGPGTLLELQLAPLDFQVVAFHVEPLQLDEQVARPVLGVDSPRGRRECRGPQDRNRDEQQFSGGAGRKRTHGRTFSATRNTLERARGLAASSSAPARILPPIRFRRGSTEAGITGRPAYTGSTVEWAWMNCLATRSSSEWKLMIASRPPTASRSSAPASARFSCPSSSLTCMRRA